MPVQYRTMAATSPVDRSRAHFANQVPHLVPGIEEADSPSFGADVRVASDIRVPGGHPSYDEWRQQIHAAPQTYGRTPYSGAAAGRDTSTALVPAQGGAIGAPMTRYSGEMDGDDLSREQLQMMKARTMFEMVEEVPIPNKPEKAKLLLLTNPQAELIASSASSLQKMIDAFEVPKPKLVINLLRSQGFRRYLHSWLPEVFAEDMVHGGHAKDASTAGYVGDSPPFLSADEERAAVERIDIFMSDVLLPLAARTNAIVFLSAFANGCILSESFTRMYSLLRNKWGRKPPFTVIACEYSLQNLYLNPDASAHWQFVRKASRSWQQRDAMLSDMVNAKFAVHGALPQSAWRAHDLDPLAPCYLLVDSIDPKRGEMGDARAFNNLMTELMRYLSNRLPSLAVKTGAVTYTVLENASTMASGLGPAMDAALSGTPLLLLDVRNRMPVEGATRAELIEKAKHVLTSSTNVLSEAGLSETFAVSSLAYLHDVLFDEVNESEYLRRGVEARLPLHRAIVRASNAATGSVGTDGAVTRATPQQVLETASWLSTQIFRDAWKTLPDHRERESRGETADEHYQKFIFAQSVLSRAILSSPNVFSVNLFDQGEAHQLVNHLVKVDRLPKRNTLEGLLILRDVWREYDVAMMLASKFKLRSKLIFGLQLLVMWLLVFCAAVSSFMLGPAETIGHHTEGSVVVPEGSSVPAWMRSHPNEAANAVLQAVHAHEVGQTALSWLWASAAPMRELVFLLSIVSSMLISLELMLNAKARWRQLRSSAGALDSMIWCFRTRVSPFEVVSSDPDSTHAEATLCNALNAWREELVSAGDLQLSDLERTYPAHVYKHCQDAGDLPDGADDCHSPVKPQTYIEMRVLPTMDFYQLRIPVYARQIMVSKLQILFAAVTCTILARYGLEQWVIVVAAGAAAITSWIEFEDKSRKVERYNRAVQALKKLVAWWESLAEMEKQMPEVIARLIKDAEMIISEERAAWISTAHQSSTSALDARHGFAAPAGTKTGRATGSELL